MKDRIVITGIGIVSALGIGVEDNIRNLRNGKSGVCSVKYLKTNHIEFPVGEVKASSEELCDALDISFNNYISRTFLLGAMAVKEALADARITDRKDLALISGTTVGGIDITEQHYPEPLPENYPAVHDCGSNTNSIADYFGNFNFTSTLSTACSSALNALIFGKMLLETGEKEVVVAGGSEALSKFHLNGFKSLMILDKELCRPFDKTRAGLNLGEGAAYFVMERESSALKRGANIYGILSGVGNACDAFHQTASSDNGEGAYLAMKQALDNAILQPCDIGYVSAHGTGTPNNDASESCALHRIFGEKMPPVSSTKALTGHTTSASGSIEAAFCLFAINGNFIPANVGFLSPDENCIIPYSGGLTNVNLKHTICNAFGFGGNDSSIILSKYE